MSTRAQRLRVAELLDGLVCQEGPPQWFISDIMEFSSKAPGCDGMLAETAWFAAHKRDCFDGRDSFRVVYAEAAQLLREGRVK